MRKIIILLVAMAFAVLFIESITISNAIAQVTYLINDDMESYDVGTFPHAGGWYNRYNPSGQNAIDNAHAHSGSKSLRLQGTHQYVALVENYNAGWQSGNVMMRYELYVYPQGGGIACNFWDDVNIGWAWGEISFQIDGYVYAQTDQYFHFTQLMPYSSDQWYKVKVEINQNGVFSVWINDIPVANKLNSPASFDHSISDSYFTIGTWQDVNYAWFDDAKVWYSPNAVPEPSTLLLLGSGLVGVIMLGKKRLFKKL